MKKMLLLIGMVYGCMGLSFSQITTNPAKIEEGYTGAITITFDPAGTDMAGQTTCYAHTGVTTEKGPWQCAPTWGKNDDKYKLTLSGSKWVLTINNMYNYYDCTTGTFTALNFVFRNAAATKQTSDLSVTIYPQGFEEKDPETKARPAGVDEGIYYDKPKAGDVTMCIYTANRAGTAAANAYLLGDFNQWTYNNNYHLYKDGAYYWITLSGLSSGTEYACQYAIKPAGSGSYIQVADPYSTKVLHRDDKYEPKWKDPTLPDYPGAGDGYVTVLQPGKERFAWSAQTTSFQKPDKNNLVVYELWVHDFSPEGSYAGVTKRLDYLQNLGVNVVELMPVCEFEGNVSWGYNPTMYFAPDKAYGSEKELKTLIDACHRRGMAVVLDMVFNHAKEQNPQCKLYPRKQNAWFLDNDGGFGPEWNHDFIGTQTYFQRVLKFWIDEYKVDGYRMDIAHEYCGPTCANRNSILTNMYEKGVKAGNPNAYFILEYWDSDASTYVGKGMPCWLNTTYHYYQAAMGWLKADDSGHTDGLDAANQDGYVTYAGSHDEQRYAWKCKKYGNGNTKNEADRIARAPLMMAFSTLLNGPQMVWMYDEMGYDYSICANQKGEGDDKSEGVGCYRTDPKPLPETKGWYRDTKRMAAYQKSGQIIQLRTRLKPSVFAGNPTNSDLGGGKSARSVIWGSGNDRIFVVGNFNVSGSTQYAGAVNIFLPEGNSWYDYLANGTEALPAGKNISLQPGEVKIYTASRMSLPDVPAYYDFTPVEELRASSVACEVYPTIATSTLTVDAAEPVQSLYALSLGGVRYPLQLSEQGLVDVSRLPRGLYLLVLRFSQEERSFKIIKQ